MAGSTLAALLGLCLVLVAGSETGKAMEDFDLSKFAGLWYEISFAAKAGVPGATPKVEKMRGVVLRQERGDLVLIVAYYEGSCVVEKFTVTKKAVPGMFTITREGGKDPRTKEVQVMSTDHETYAIMDNLFLKDGVNHRVMKLYSRSLDHNQNALRKFREVAQEHGFQEPDFHLLSHDLSCLKVLQGLV